MVTDDIRNMLSALVLARTRAGSRRSQPLRIADARPAPAAAPVVDTACISAPSNADPWIDVHGDLRLEHVISWNRVRRRIRRI